MVQLIDKESSHQFARISTGTMVDLICASERYASQSHGRWWAYLDASAAYLETAVFSIARLIKHVAFAIISVPAFCMSSNHNFFYENICRAAIDIGGGVIGLVGMVFPYYAQAMTVRMIFFINTWALDKKGLPEQFYEEKNKVTNAQVIYQLGQELHSVGLCEALSAIQDSSKD